MTPVDILCFVIFWNREPPKHETAPTNSPIRGCGLADFVAINDYIDATFESAFGNLYREKRLP